MSYFPIGLSCARVQVQRLSKYCVHSRSNDRGSPQPGAEGENVPSFVRDELSFLKLDSVLVDLNGAVLIFFLETNIAKLCLFF